MTTVRLTAASLDGVLPRPGVTAPPPGGHGRDIGILHLGIGAFHRAHQAVFTEDAVTATGEGGWGICGVTQRSATVADQLLPQDCRYGVLERGLDTTSLRIVGQVADVVFPARDAGRLWDRFTDPAVRVVTLTVTEKGYRRDAAGHLDVTDAVVRADLDGGHPRSTVGVLARGLQRRAAATGAPITVLTCDNLTGNGRVLQRLVADFCAALPTAEGEPLAAWIERSVTFPNSMVDRIVPATTAGDRADAEALLGLRDEALVVAEPFRQWVVEDLFAAGRPAWERAGASLVTDVEPFEQLKLRMLNGTHSLLAYLGALAGHATIAEAVRHPALAETAQQMITEDVAPTLVAPPGVDVAVYGRSVLDRFANPALRHLTTQVAMDGSQKLPLRLLGTVRDRLAAGATPRWAIRGVAAWMAYVTLGADRTGRPLPLDDPMADRLRSAVAGAQGAPAVATALLGVAEIFPHDLAASSTFRDCLTEQLAELLATAP
ncbi:MAG: fructuronate reductase [Actinomycetota bacterium]|nr:fructuronate reductase [Actinomycetota bacterium]